jgi:hypothetical protein
MEFSTTFGFEMPEDFYDAALHGATIATISYCLGLRLTDMTLAISAITTDGQPTLKPRLEFGLLDQIKAAASTQTVCCEALVIYAIVLYIADGAWRDLCPAIARRLAVASHPRPSVFTKPAGEGIVKGMIEAFLRDVHGQSTAIVKGMAPQIKAVAQVLLITGSLSAEQLQKLMHDLYPGCEPGTFRD